MIPFIWYIQIRQIHGDGMHISGYQVMGEEAVIT